MASSTDNTGDAVVDGSIDDTSGAATTHTRDIYKAVVTNVSEGMNWFVCTLTEARRCDVTKLIAPDSIQLSKGFWEIELQSISSSVFTIQIVRGDNDVIYQKDCPVLGGSTDRHLTYAKDKIEIRVRARRNSRESLLKLGFFIIIGRI
jgi:hypothetical protein